MGEENKGAPGGASPDHPRREELDYYEIDLRDYLHVLWRGKWIVLATFLAAVGAAAFISFTTRPIYQTELGLLIFPPIYEGEEITGTVYSPETYRSLALAGDLLEEVINEVFPKGNGPSVEDLRSSLEAKVMAPEKPGAEFPGRFPLHLKVSLKGKDPRKLKEIAEVWARKFIERNTELFLTRTAQSYSYFKESLEEIDQELRAKENEYKRYLQENRLEVLRAEMEALKAEYKQILSILEDKRRSLSFKEAELSSLQTSFLKEPLFFTLERSIPKESFWELALGKELSPEELKKLPELKTFDQVLNFAHISLRQRIASLKAEVDSLKREVAELEADLSEIGSQVAEKEAKLAEVEIEISRYERELNALKKSYTQLSTKLLEAKVARAETAEPIRVVEEPFVPSVPVGPNRKMNIAVAGVLGLFVGVLLAFLWNYLKGPEETTG